MPNDPTTGLSTDDQSFGIYNQDTSAASNVDVSELTRNDGTVVERQRVTIADPNAGEMCTGLMASVVGEKDRGAMRADPQVIELLQAILECGNNIVKLLSIALDTDVTDDET